MRLISFAVAALAVLPGALAVDVKKQIIVWFDGGAPESVIAKAREGCVKAGAEITHDFKMLSGFSAVVATDALEAVRALSGEFSQYNYRVDDDGEVRINN